MNSKIIIGITKNHTNEVEQQLQGIRYRKEVTSQHDYFMFDYYDWDDPDDGFPTTLMTYLIAVIQYNSFGFIRLGEEPDDTEIHGDIDLMNIRLTRTIGIGNE